MITLTLNEAYARYKDGSLSWAPFVSVCYVHIGDMVARIFRIPKTDKDDIAADFFPRFCDIVERYEERGSTFEAYLKVSLRFFCRTYTRTRRDRQSQELLVSDIDEIPYTGDLVTGAPLDCADLDPSPRSTALLSETRTKDTIRRQILISFCKNFPLLSEEDAQDLAQRLDIPSAMVDVLTAYTHDRRDIFLDLRCEYRRLRDENFARMQECQIKAAGEECSQRRNAMIERSKRYRYRWNHYRRRLKRQNIHLSNREVGVLLGIPKGSVDSAMANFGRRLELFIIERYSHVYEDHACVQQPS